MGWNESARAFTRGLVLGQRAQFHDDKMEVVRAREEREKKRSKREEEKHAEWKRSSDKKKRFEVVKREVDTAKAMISAGQSRAAAKKIVDLYNNEYPNQDEARIIFREDDPENEIWSKGNMQGKEVALLTKNWGVLPAKNLKDVMGVISSNLDYDQFSKDLEGVTKAVAEKNASEKPFKAQDGKMYIQQWEEGPGGSVVKAGDPVPYQGKQALKGFEKKVSEAGLDPSKLTTKEKQIGAGIREKIKEPKPGDTSAAGKKKAEEFIKDLKILGKPFAKPGKEMIDPQTLEIKNEGKSAWDAANDFLQKYKDKKELSPAERRKVDDAKRFLEVFEKISKYTASKYLGKGSGKGWHQYAGDAPIKKTNDGLKASH